ncbi:MAG: phosphoglycerate dehydrogenase [Thermodesulfobacteriota bacterium]
MRVLVSDNLAPAGVSIMREAGLAVDVRTGLPPAELKAIIKDYHGLVIRSATKVTAEIIEAADSLKAVGRAGIGLDNVDVAAATQRGIVVMNAPEGNTTTTAEHALAMLMALSRNIPQATASMKAGKWEKKRFMGREITGKTLGIIGIGRIGSIVANRAAGLRMQVIAFDPHIPADVAERLGIELVSLADLYRRSDYISVHVPLTKETQKLVGREAFAAMKKDAMLIDCARGGIVDEEALLEALQGGEIAGAALDVFAKEPTTAETPLLALDNFICTPHLGASTTEAQENVATAIAQQMADYLLRGTVTNAVNVPSVSAEMLSRIGPYVALAERLGSFHMQIAQGSVSEVTLEYTGDLAEINSQPITVAFLKGLFTPILQDAVNYVNAPVIAQERGIRVVESKSRQSEDFTNLLTVRVRAAGSDNVLAGTVFGRKEPRLVRLNTFRLEADIDGPMLFVYNRDRPGVIGALGSTIGNGGVNISRMAVGQEGEKGRNIILLATDPLIGKDLLQTVRELPQIDDAWALEV